jgi:hypothetical protein
MLKFQRAWCVGNINLAIQTNRCTTNQSDPVENVIIARININSSHLTMSVSSHGPSFYFYLMFLFVFMTLVVYRQGKSFLQCREMDFIVDVRGVRIHHRTMDRHLSHLGLCIYILVGVSQSFRLFYIPISRTLTILHFAPAVVFQVPLVEGERIASW